MYLNLLLNAINRTPLLSPGHDKLGYVLLSHGRPYLWCTEVWGQSNRACCCYPINVNSCSKTCEFNSSATLQYKNIRNCIQKDKKGWQGALLIRGWYVQAPLELGPLRCSHFGTPSFQRAVCTGFNGGGTSRCVPIRQVSSFQ